MTTTRTYFGTDGVRGTANQWPIVPEFITQLALAVGTFFKKGDHRQQVVIGKDTRLSCYMVESALVAGFAAAGMDVMLMGPMPTPGVSAITRMLRADCGVMISASHNPFEDNGIKFFDAEGHKLSDAAELSIEKILDDRLFSQAIGAAMGRVRRLEDAQGRYIEFVKSSLPRGMRFNGLKVVIDCANGAAYKIAPKVLWELGADIIPLGVDPNGENVNLNSGATAPETMRQAVITHGADLGIALDGDADRVILCDAMGRIIDGDQILALLATHMKTQGQLTGNVVGTVMTNLGLEKYLATQSIGLTRTPVGDRYIAEVLRTQNANIGGEPSGHIILSDYGPTGDGLLAALQVIACLHTRGQSATDVFPIFTPVPQLLRNYKGMDESILTRDNVQQVITRVQDQMNGHGRINIRKSGTEKLLRVMVECEDTKLLDEVIAQVDQALLSVG